MKILHDVETIAAGPLLSDPGPDDADRVEPLLTEAAGRYIVTFLPYSARFTFDRLADSSRGAVSAELTVHCGTKELLGETDIGLKANSTRETIARTLNNACSNEIPWKRLLDRACAQVLKRHRHGEPTALLEPTASSHVPFILNPLVYQGHQSLIYAPGGSCKSYLALYFALLVCHGLQQNGIGGVKAPVLFLDWELNRDTVGGRLRALQLGHPELGHVRPYYRRCEAPLHQEAHQIAHTVGECGIRLVILDSAAMACGGDLSSPDAAIGLQRALRRIGCASLLLAHVAKNTQEGQQATAYGTVFFRELARNVWELTKASDANPMQVVLSQQKNNFGPKHDPLGFALSFQDEAVQVDAFNPADEPAFEDKLSVRARIRNLLEDGMPRTAKEIAGELDVKIPTIKSTLSREKGRKWMSLGDDYHNPKWTVLRSK